MCRRSSKSFQFAHINAKSQHCTSVIRASNIDAKSQHCASGIRASNMCGTLLDCCGAWTIVAMCTMCGHVIFPRTCVRVPFKADLLYSNNFAVHALHEAATATGDPTLAAASTASVYHPCWRLSPKWPKLLSLTRWVLALFKLHTHTHTHTHRHARTHARTPSACLFEPPSRSRNPAGVCLLCVGADFVLSQALCKFLLRTQITVRGDSFEAADVEAALRLEGSWLRSFDFERWEPYAQGSDWSWGRSPALPLFLVALCFYATACRPIPLLLDYLCCAPACHLA